MSKAVERKILITGGAGFIGSHVVRLFVNKYPHYQIVNLDKLTYAGNLENLKDIEAKNNYRFVLGDITDQQFIQAFFKQENFDGVLHLAAESHVDRSLENPTEFVMTNIIGTLNLLQAATTHWKNNFSNKRFYLFVFYYFCKNRMIVRQGNKCCSKNYFWLSRIYFYPFIHTNNVKIKPSTL